MSHNDPATTICANCGAQLAAIHFHAVVFLALALMVALRWGGGRYGGALGGLVPFAIWIYGFGSLRRVFEGSRWETTWKGLLLSLVYTAIIGGTMLLLGLRSLRAH